ncbi:cell death abnormality protein 1 [Biomphalaria pfeifferi]|uniref:Cell death abnormality protein 1 n=1 Tax=Biomphalaria pfeifferi TaxID=112525 RepID=A0AAD8B2P1_BIOPF|nr:cell death abnormality protein 1 [Biomphalaria pfeifferi]
MIFGLLMKMRWIMLIIFMGLIQIIACQVACPAGWFGPKCQFQCHCQTKCDSTGECEENLCSVGWFGYKCQYQDFVSRFEVQDSDPERQLSRWSKGDYSDCIEDRSIKLVEIYLKKPFLFTWISLTVKNPGLLRTFSITLVSNLKKWDCEQTITSIVKNTVNIRCDGREYVKKIILTGDGVHSLCTIHVSNGRNMALKRPVTTDLNEVITDLTAIGDDNTDTNLVGSCTAIDDANILPSTSWSLTFEEPVVASSYKIISKGNYTGQGDLLVEFYDENKNVIIIMMDSYNAQLYSYDHKEPISGLKITYKQTNSSPSEFSLCQISVFGECVPGRWGLDCKNSCGSECPDSCNESDGTCPID